MIPWFFPSPHTSARVNCHLVCALLLCIAYPGYKIMLSSVRDAAVQYVHGCAWRQLYVQLCLCCSAAMMYGADFLLFRKPPRCQFYTVRHLHHCTQLRLFYNLDSTYMFSRSQTAHAKAVLVAGTQRMRCICAIDYVP